MEKHIPITAFKSARGNAPYLRVETKLDSRLNAKLETKPDAKHAIRMI